MTRNAKVVLVAAFMFTGMAVFARPCYRERDGLDIAVGIVELVQRVVAPEYTYTYTVPQTVVVVADRGYDCPPPPRHVRPMPPPPPRRHVRPMPPPPPRHHVRPMPPPPPRRHVRPMPPPNGHHRPGYRR